MKPTIISENSPLPFTLLRRPEVEQITGFTRSGLYRLIQNDQFPRPVKTGARAVAWRSTDIATWMENLEPCAGGVAAQG